MPLTIRLKPGERLILNGAVVRNGSSHSVALDVLNKVTTLHERDLILPEQADTPIKVLYLLVQMMHLEAENEKIHYDKFIRLSAEIYAETMKTGDVATGNLVSDLISLVGERSLPAALRRLQKEIGRPGDERTGRTPNNKMQDKRI
jgi:flagellar biosynthesis repressor protein FlbT